MKKRSTEMWVGIFVVIGILLLVVLTLKVEKFQIGRKAGYLVNINFDSASGLDRSASVRVAGVHVGTVEKVSLKEGKAKVTFRVPADIILYKDAKAYLKSEGFLGEKYVEISPGTPGFPRVQPEGEIEQGTPPADFEQVLSKIGGLREDIKDVTKPLGDVLKAVDTKKVEGMITNLNKFSNQLSGIGSEAKETIQKAKDAFSRVEEIGDRVNKGEGTLGKLISDDSVYQEAKKTVETAREAAESVKKAAATLKDISETIERGEGTLGKLIKDETLYSDAKELAATLKDISETIERGEGTLGRLIKDETLYSDAKELAATLKDISETIERGEGTLGKLIKDETLYNDARELVQSTKETMKSAKDAVESVKGITDKVEKGEGTLGKLVSDDKLMKEAEKTMKKIQKAAEGIEEQTPITVLGTLIGIFF